MLESAHLPTLAVQLRDALDDNSINVRYQPIVRLDDPTHDAMNSPDPPLEEFVLPALVYAVVASSQPFVLVLDDAHLVTERRCFNLIDYLAERLAVGCQLAAEFQLDWRVARYADGECGATSCWWTPKESSTPST